MPSFTPEHIISSSCGWVGGGIRNVETYASPSGVLLCVDGGSGFYITPEGSEITRPGREGEPLEGLDLEIQQGPALVLAHSMRGHWCLHGSAASLNGKNIAFLGESGYGKSTLAAYLGHSGWQRVADDILPVTLNNDKVLAWPHFPQLKLSNQEQPALYLPESLNLDAFCLVCPADEQVSPRLERLSSTDAVIALLSHTAGTRMFGPDLLSKHLAFCAQAGRQLVAYRLVYPHRRETLPLVRELLEKIPNPA